MSVGSTERGVVWTFWAHTLHVSSLLYFKALTWEEEEIKEGEVVKCGGGVREEGDGSAKP